MNDAKVPIRSEDEQPEIPTGPGGEADEGIGAIRGILFTLLLYVLGGCLLWVMWAVWGHTHGHP